MPIRGQHCSNGSENKEVDGTVCMQGAAHGALVLMCCSNYLMSRSTLMSLHTTGLKCRAPARLLHGHCGRALLSHAYHVSGQPTRGAF